MIALLIHVLILLLVFGLVWWAVTAILKVMPVPEPFKTIIYVILVVLACLVLLYYILPVGGIALPAR